MSSTPKGTVLRLILPKESSPNVLNVLGPLAKMETRDIVLQAGRLTTEEMVKYIREYTRLRDEILHTMRLLGIPREARNSSEELPEHGHALGLFQKKLEEIRGGYQGIQRRIETLERQMEETRRQADRMAEVVDAGFPSDEILHKGGGFSKILGRIPTRKLESARRSLETVLKDQAILATGNRKGDWIYVLLATPSEKALQVLQTLLLYDFVQTEVPTTEEPDLKKAQASQVEKKEKLVKEIEAGREEMGRFRGEASENLNRLCDIVQEGLILTRAILKMGEGASVAHAFARLDKGLPPKVLSALSRQGVLLETE